MTKIKYLPLLALIGLAACGTFSRSAQEETKVTYPVHKTDSEWKAQLTPDQYRVLRNAATERAFSGAYNDHWEKGIYRCAACGTPLFNSDTKYEHGTGWPSYTAPVKEANIEYRKDNSLLMNRIEVRCATCGSHLGHVFDDGPSLTRKHFCINSTALDFKPAGSSDKACVEKTTENKETARAIFAAGCFWGVEDKFSRVPGVMDVRSGYTGGSVPKPSYRQVCSGDTGHAEAVEVIFDPALVSYEQLLEVFFKIHDPTQVDRQGPDVGSQYRSGIFYLDEEQHQAAKDKIAELEKSGRFRKPIATRVVSAARFFQAEEAHQDYYKKIRK